MTYTIDSKIGKRDSMDKVNITSMVVVSGTHQLVPPYPLGRRSFIQIKNEGAVDVSLTTESGISVSDGYIIDANGGVWSDYTNATFYIVSTGFYCTVKVYERSTGSY